MASEREQTPADNGAAITSLFENSREVMFVLDGDRRFSVVNPAWTRATGWSEAEMRDRPLAELAHPEDLARLSAGAPEVGVCEHRARIRRKDGGWLWIDGQAQRTSDNHVIGVFRAVADGHDQIDELENARRKILILAEAAGIGAWSYEPEEGLVRWSKQLQAIADCDLSDESTPAQLRAFMHPDEHRRIEATIARSVRDGLPRTIEHRLRLRDGGWGSFRATFHGDPRPGGAFALRGISQDITELALARDAARKSEQQIRQLIEGAPFAVAMFDREMRYLVVSPRWLATFGLGEREHRGRRLDAVFPEIPRRFMIAARRAVGGETVSRDEDRFTDSRGHHHWIRWEANPWRDASGEIGGIVAYIDDISALARTRHEAQTSSRRLKLALGAAEAGVYEVDHVAKTSWASPELRRLIGGGPPNFDSVRRLEYPTFHPDDLGHVREAFKAIHRGEMSSGEGFEARIITPTGRERWVRIFHHLQVSRSGRWLKAVGLVQDFDERKRQEIALIEAERAAQSAADAKSQFLANMSHEIRTPMNGVMGVLHLLKTEALSGEGRKLLDEALNCGEMLNELLNDVIDFSKIEAGRLELACDPLDPAELLEGVARLLSPQAQDKGLTLRVDLPARPGWIRSDPVRLRQALFNLIGNAVKFTLAGGVTVRCATVERPTGPRLRFEVEDTGVGIPAEVQPRIFQRFDQGDASTTRRFGGSGLGLAITRRLAEMMAGEVGFTSVEGQGSTFWLEVAAEPAQPVAAPDEADQACLDGLRVLVVEDNPTNRLIATKLLENLGAVVETAPDGLLGVEAATRGAFDLILMDVQMPGIDGLEAARRIRALPGPVARTPIVALTANVLSHQRKTYLESGMDGVVGKPISPASLLTEIARLSTPPDDLAAARA